MSRDELNALIAASPVKITRVSTGARGLPDMTANQWRSLSQASHVARPQDIVSTRYVGDMSDDSAHARGRVVQDHAGRNFYYNAEGECLCHD